MNNIITIDGFQVATIEKYGVIPKHHINQYKKQFCEDMGIGCAGIGCVYQKPEEGLKLWKPK
ncbi:MAG TPA: hypothetical protein PLQ39_13290 [Acinetobacter sp.]|nr:hypothetical protein [Acinetobacter sp.]